MPHLILRAFGLCSTIVAASGCATSALLEQELTKTNTQTVLAFEETVYNKHNVHEAFRHYIAEGFIEHDPLLAGDQKPAGTTAAERAYRALIGQEGAHAHRTFARSIAQGELVATQSLWSVEAPAASLPVVDIYRLREGRIVEHWDVVGSPAGARLRGTGARGSGGEAFPGATLPP